MPKKVYPQHELTWKEKEIKRLTEDILDIDIIDQVSSKIKDKAKKILELLEE